MGNEEQTIQSTVRTLERGLDVLCCLGNAGKPLTLTVIAEITGLSPSTTLRILSALEKKGFITRNMASKRYSLGLTAMNLGNASSGIRNLAALALQPMRDLNRCFGESISLYTPDGNQRVCIQRVESTFPLRRVVNIGDRLSLAIGAGGKILAAWLALVRSFDPAKLMPPLSSSALAHIRAEGYAVSFGEREEGVYAVAAPIFDHEQSIVASLSFSGPTARFSPDALPGIAAAVKEKADAITASIAEMR